MVVKIQPRCGWWFVLLQLPALCTGLFTFNPFRINPVKASICFQAENKKSVIICEICGSNKHYIFNCNDITTNWRTMVVKVQPPCGWWFVLLQLPALRTGLFTFNPFRINLIKTSICFQAENKKSVKYAVLISITFLTVTT